MQNNAFSPSISLYISLFVCLSVRLYNCLFVCLSVRLLVCISVFVCLSVSLFVSICLCFITRPISFLILLVKTFFVIPWKSENFFLYLPFNITKYKENWIYNILTSSVSWHHLIYFILFWFSFSFLLTSQSFSWCVVNGIFNTWIYQFKGIKDKS